MRFPARILTSLAMAAAVVCSAAGMAAASTGSAARPDGGDGFSISLAASTTFAFVGTAVTITATTNADVGPTPYWISVYDVTTQTELAVCGAGTTCSATVSQGAPGTQTFEAYVGDYPPPSSPPGFIIVSSNTVSVLWWELIHI